MSAVATPSAPTAPMSPPPAETGPRPWKWTRADYYKLGELGFFDGKRVELIRGEIVEMSPISWPHTVGKSLVAAALRPVFAGIGTVMEQTPHPMEDSDPEPDIRVIPGQMEDYTDHPREALLVVEVSIATLDYDRTTKAELYAESGIKDYWILDVKNRQLYVFRDPKPVTTGLGATAFRTHLALGPADTVSPLAATQSTIRVSDLLPAKQ